MKKTLLALMSLVCLAAFVGCNHYETYGDKKDKERKAIRQFISDSAIVVIDEAVFHANGDVTDLEKNEFVYLSNSGVYMQIVNKGCGEPLRDGEQTDLLVRFLELCIMDSTALYNDTAPYDVDVLNVLRSGGSYSGSFTEGLMRTTYGVNGMAAQAAAGQLVAFPYINVGRPRSADDQVAKVRLIVPHSQGHRIATNYVYPYYYEFTFQRKIDL